MSVTSPCHVAVGSRVLRVKVDGGSEVQMPHQSSSKVRSLEAALTALGPEESSAKTEIGLALK